MGLLEELAVRCEAATGADRDVDGWAFCSVNPDETTVIDHEPGRFPRKSIYGPVSVIMDKIGGKDGAEYLCAPAYTSSLDAAMTLVPAGLRLTFSEWDDEKHLRPRGPWQAILTKAGSGSSFNDMFGYRCDHAATPALAVCAAALRARHALALSKGSEGC